MATEIKTKNGKWYKIEKDGNKFKVKKYTGTSFFGGDNYETVGYTYTKEDAMTMAEADSRNR